jgi:hypothetical protein
MMISKKNTAALALAVLICLPVSSFAVEAFSDNNETTGYVGLQWFTEETAWLRPNIVAGVRHTKTAAADNNVTGYDVMLTYSLEKNQFDALRVGYLDGKCNTLATAGVGYSFKKSTALGFIGAVGPYARVIAELDSNMHPGLGLDLNSLGCADDRKATAAVPV